MEKGAPELRLMLLRRGLWHLRAHVMGLLPRDRKRLELRPTVANAAFWVEGHCSTGKETNRKGESLLPSLWPPSLSGVPLAGKGDMSLKESQPQPSRAERRSVGLELRMAS